MQSSLIASEGAIDKDVHERTWRDVYAAYKWLCKIKHPTTMSAVHDAGATSLRSYEYVVMAAPDIRPEDLSVKSTILTIAISRVYEATRSFVAALDCDTMTPAYESFETRIAAVLPAAKEAHKVSYTHDLPFNLRGSPLEKEWAELKRKEMKR